MSLSLTFVLPWNESVTFLCEGLVIQALVTNSPICKGLCSHWCLSFAEVFKGSPVFCWKTMKHMYWSYGLDSKWKRSVCHSHMSGEPHFLHKCYLIFSDFLNEGQHSWATREAISPLHTVHKCQLVTFNAVEVSKYLHFQKMETDAQITLKKKEAGKGGREGKWEGWKK